MYTFNTVFPHYNLFNNIEYYLNRSNHLDTITSSIKDLALNKTSWNTERQQLILQALQKPHFSCCSLELKKICANLQPSDLHQLLKAAATLKFNPNCKTKETGEFQRLTQLLTVEQIEAAIRTEYPSYEDALKKAKELCDSAKYYLNIAKPSTVKPFLKNLLANLIWAIDQTINTLLSVFGMGDWKELQDESPHSGHAQYRLQLILSSLTKTSAWISLAIAVAGSSVAGIATVGAAFLVGSALLAIYLKYFKPVPRTITGWRNLTTEASTSLLANTRERYQYIDKIANTLIVGNQSPKIHPILTGSSGVGKTEILYGFAKAVAEGRYPALKGKQVFYINTVEFSRKGYTNQDATTIQKIQDRIRDRSEDVILIFDEIHLAFKDQKEIDFLGDRLQRLLEAGKDCFPHVIGSTTSQDYCDYIQPNSALTSRFKEVLINDPSKEETLAILKRNILSHQKLDITEEAIEAIYSLSKDCYPNHPQPYAACHLLAQLIHAFNESAASQIQSLIDEKQAALEQLMSSQFIDFDMNFLHSPSHKNIMIQTKQLQDEIDLLIQKLNEETNNRKKFQQLTKQHESEKQKALNLSIKISQAPKKKAETLIKEFASSSYHIQASRDALEMFRRGNHSLTTHIDLTFVEKVVSQIKQ